MARPLNSVRARATLAATAVVCVALVAAGFAVLAVLRHNLTGRAGLEAEVTARTVAGSQDALNGRFDRLDLPGDGRVVQVVGSDGRVLSSDAVLVGRSPVADYARAAAGVTAPRPLRSSPDSTHAESTSPAFTAPARYAPVRTGAAHTVTPVEDHGRRGRGGDDRGGSGGGTESGDDHGGRRGGLETVPTPSVEDDTPRATPTPSTPPRGEVGTGVERRTITATVAGATHDYSFAAVQGTSYDGRTYTVYAGVSLDDEQATIGQVTDSLLAGLPFLLAVVAAVTWLVTRRALRPVEGIRAEMAEITGSGDLSRRVPEPRSGDEIARLARTTNSTLAALERSVERQHRFIADASHELRSPIANLRTQLEVADAHPDLLDTRDLVQDVVRLQNLATDLLLLARLDAGESPAHARVDLTTLVHEEVAARVGTDRLPISVDLGDRALATTGSRTQLSRVLGNLLDNAQRHAASRVTVTAAVEDGAITLTVLDDGPGVPPEDRERIFERFVRLDDARSRDTGGAGLGLAIARDVMHRHGGSLTVGGAPGEGAVFRARLPDATGPGDEG